MRVARVGDIADQIRGVTYSKGDASRIPLDTHTKLLRAMNIGDSGILMEDLIHVPKSKVSQRQFLQPNDVLIAASSGSLSVVGKAARVVNPIDGSFGAFCKVLRPRSGVDPSYFAHFFRTSDYRRHISSVAAGANINNLRGEDLDQVEIPLPPLAEQRRIAAILDEADALRTTAVTATERVDDARAAQFEHLFPSAAEHLTTIGALIESTQYGTSGKAGGTGRFPILRMGNLTARGRIDLRDMKYIDIPDQEVEKYLVRKGDVLFNRTNSAELVGKTAVYREDVPRVYAGYLVRLRASDEVVAEYIAGYLNSVHGKRTLRRMAKSIVGMANINAREVQTIRLPAPNAEKLHAYKAFVDESWSNTARFESRARELDSLFASLQHRAFRGEL